MLTLIPDCEHIKKNIVVLLWSI